MEASRKLLEKMTRESEKRGSAIQSKVIVVSSSVEILRNWCVASPVKAIKHGGSVPHRFSFGDLIDFFPTRPPCISLKRGGMNGHTKYLVSISNQNGSNRFSNGWIMRLNAVRSRSRVGEISKGIASSRGRQMSRLILFGIDAFALGVFG